MRGGGLWFCPRQLHKQHQSRTIFISFKRANAAALKLPDHNALELTDKHSNNNTFEPSYEQTNTIAFGLSFITSDKLSNGLTDEQAYRLTIIDAFKLTVKFSNQLAV